ncbi:MAG: hypothetical protein FWC41_04980 [Firmicutes bacterium]|nr:hypothetical protein [Bacillota bacterium]
MSDEEISDAAGGVKHTLSAVAGFIPGFVMKNKIRSVLGATGIGIALALVVDGAKDISDGNYKKGVAEIITALGAVGFMTVGAGYLFGEKKEGTTSSSLEPKTVEK